MAEIKTGSIKAYHTDTIEFLKDVNGHAVRQILEEGNFDVTVPSLKTRAKELIQDDRIKTSFTITKLRNRIRNFSGDNQ